MAHLGTRAFEEIGGEVVQTTTFILQERKMMAMQVAMKRLVDYGSQDGKEEKYLEIVDGKDIQDLYQVSQDNFIRFWQSYCLLGKVRI